jgi:hypothetical protein
MSRARTGALALLAATGAGVRAVMKRRRSGEAGDAERDPGDGQPDSRAPDPAIYAGGPANPTLMTQSSPGTIAAQHEAHGAGAGAPAGSAPGAAPGEGGGAGEAPGTAPAP